MQTTNENNGLKATIVSNSLHAHITPQLAINLDNEVTADKEQADNKKAALVIFIDSKQMDDVSQQVHTGHAEVDAYINNLVHVASFAGDMGDTLLDYQFSLAGFSCLLLMGVDAPSKVTPNKLQKLGSNLYKQLSKNITHAAIQLKNTFSQQDFSQLSLALLNASYRFDAFKSKQTVATLADVRFVTENIAFTNELDYVVSVFKGQCVARNFANLPANICYPAYMADEALALAQMYPDLLRVEVLGEADMEKLGMGCFLSVSKGSEREGKLISIEYKGAEAKTDAPIVLVGKGVTFDTGGISIKPGAGMEEMKFDMCGAASVIGTMRALCEAKLPLHVVGTMACAENMPSGKATRPGDVVTSMSGKTVEILNTDAEGRLVLSDALTYVEKYNPSLVINMATLTGACIIALGHVRSALYTKDVDLAADLIAASAYSHDRVWHMPLDNDYQEQLDSPIADIQNIGGRPAGSVTAACFLSRFTNNYRWAHLDIAGTAWVSGKNRNATGRPVPLLMQFLRSKISAPT